VEIIVDALSSCSARTDHRRLKTKRIPVGAIAQRKIKAPSDRGGGQPRRWNDEEAKLG
jgi:hypothetical protein